MDNKPRRENVNQENEKELAETKATKTLRINQDMTIFTIFI